MDMRPETRGDAPPVRWWPSPPTAGLAIVGASVWVSGFFLLAAAGRDYGGAVLGLILAGALAVSVPILALAILITASEAVVGRAWASGFARLTSDERGWRAITSRAFRYAGFLWLANGSALWFATVVAQF
ncbi:MAG: hypothetical protein M0R73_03885 [Dehalococcoidia bacterium]|nr:hypothetical protein [Dehalococcoidia bacterium]